MVATAPRKPRRRTPPGPALAEVAGSASGPHLLPYQRRWVADVTPMKVWGKSRRIGADYCEAAGVVLSRLRGTRKEDMWYSSADESAAEEYIIYVQHFAGAFKRVVDVIVDTEVCDGVVMKKFIVELPDPNGRIRRVTAMTSNPTRFRSKGGDVTLSELAFHKDPRGMFKAAKPVTAQGGTLAILSSHNGVESYFNELLCGARRVRDGERRHGDLAFSLHETYLPDAIDDGLVEMINRAKGTRYTRESYYEYLRSTTPPADFDEEFLGIPSAESRSYFGYEMLRQIVREHDPKPTSDVHTFLADVRRVCEPEERGGLGAERLYAGVDVGLTNHRFVIDCCAKVGGMIRTAGILVMKGAGFDEMEFAVGSLMGLRAGPGQRASVKKLAIDATGMGMQMGHRGQKAYGSRFEPVTFSLPVKEDLATRARAACEERTMTLPDDQFCLSSFNAIRQERTASGKPRYVGEENEEGHQDFFWARTLTLAAAESRSEVRAVEVERGAWM